MAILEPNQKIPKKFQICRNSDIFFKALTGDGEIFFGPEKEGLS